MECGVGPVPSCGAAETLVTQHQEAIKHQLFQKKGIVSQCDLNDIPASICVPVAMGPSLLHSLACSVNSGESNPEGLLGLRGMAHGPGSSDAHFLRAKLAETFESQILESRWEWGLQLWPSQFLSLLAGGLEAALQGSGKVSTLRAPKFLAF